MKNTLLFCLVALFFAAGCAYTQKIKDGAMAYDRKQYAVAIPMLKKEYQKSKSRIERGKIAFMLGESYRKTQQVEAAIEWYPIAYDYGVGEEALKQYAYALKRTGQYEKAKTAFKDLGIEIGSPYEYRREIQACELAISWEGKDKSREYLVQPAAFNSSNSEYAPAVTPHQQLVFTSDRNGSMGDAPYNWTGNPFSDLYALDLNSNEINPFDNNINTVHNEGTAAFNSTFTEMYFSRCYNDEKRNDHYCKLMLSTKEGDSWSVPQPLDFVRDKVNYGHPALSADGNTLYFASDDPDGWGGYDIYYCKRTAGDWSEPKMLPRGINTPGDEKFPSVHHDTLYFSSDYIAGMGGLDIFKTYKMGDRWSPAHNLKAPINSSEDDFGFVVNIFANNPSNILESGFFTSSRSGGQGGDDIYLYEKVVPPPPPPAPDTVVAEPEPIVYKMLLDIYVLEKIYKIAGNPNSAVLGRKPLEGAKITATFGKSKKEYEVGPDGLLQLELEEDTYYDFFASKPDYLNNTGKFSTKGIGKDPNNPILKFELEIELDKIFKNTEITLDNIYYDYDKWDIRPDAEPTLDKLATTLAQTPTSTSNWLPIPIAGGEMITIKNFHKNVHSLLLII